MRRGPLAGAAWAGYGGRPAGTKGDSLNPLYENMTTSVFERMSALAAKHGAVNLGQGFPDFGWPDEILDAAARAVKEGSNQYPPSRGLPALREAVAAHYGRHHGSTLDAEHVCVTSGATEALGAAILATVEPGRRSDHLHAGLRQLRADDPAGRRRRPAKSRCSRPAGGSSGTRSRPRSAPKTRAIIFNNPHNPTGRLFDARRAGGGRRRRARA